MHADASVRQLYVCCAYLNPRQSRYRNFGERTCLLGLIRSVNAIFLLNFKDNSLGDLLKLNLRNTRKKSPHKNAQKIFILRSKLGDLRDGHPFFVENQRSVVVICEIK